MRVQSAPRKLLLRVVALALVLAAGFGPDGVSQSTAHEAEHMRMTALRPLQPGDQQRADAIVAAARATMAQYADYRKALAAGFEIYLPGIPQPVYHFTRPIDLRETPDRFDPSRPTSLLYVRQAAPAPRFRIVGVMYTARFGVSEEELNRRVPLSFTRWHLHTNLCLPRSGPAEDGLVRDPRFGLQGSISTPEACQAAGGVFAPQQYLWMVHVYASETDPARIWVSGDADERGMQHGAMKPGQPM